MFIPYICIWVSDRKIWSMGEEEDRTEAATALRAYDRPLEIVLSFKYLGLLLTVTGDNWTDIIANLWKARKIWS